MLKEKDIFRAFLKEKGLKLTKQREEILSTFLKTEIHLSTEDLYGIVNKKDPSIGLATVFRTLKLLSEAGIARRVDLGDKRLRFEHKYGHQHHDHLICRQCGHFIEAVDNRIEKLQKELCKKYKFSLDSHRLEIFGVCSRCQKKEEEKK